MTSTAAISSSQRMPPRERWESLYDFLQGISLQERWWHELVSFVLRSPRLRFRTWVRRSRPERLKALARAIYRWEYIVRDFLAAVESRRRQWLRNAVRFVFAARLQRDAHSYLYGRFYAAV